MPYPRRHRDVHGGSPRRACERARGTRFGGSFRRPVAAPSRGSARIGENGGTLPDFSEPCVLDTPAAPTGFAASARVVAGPSGVSRHGLQRSGTAHRHERTSASGTRRGRHHGRKRQRLFRHKARGRRSQTFAPHAGRPSRERGRALHPPLRQPRVVSQVGSGRVGGEAPGDYDGGGGPAGCTMRGQVGSALESCL